MRTAPGDPSGGEAGPPTQPPQPARPAPATSDALAAKLAAAKAYKAAAAAAKAAVTGGVASPATFLTGAEAALAPELAADPSLRLEDVSRLREAEARERGAGLITARPGAVIRRGVAASSDEEAEETAGVEASAAAAFAEEEHGGSGSGDASPSSAAAAATPPPSSGTDSASPAYKPKVSTWGVFERPSNISEAYGGGRTIRPGQPLESPEQAAAREARTAALLAAFKTKAGLDAVDPEEEAAANAQYEAGMALLRKGDLDGASVTLGAAAARLPARSRTAGLAALNKAIADDSLGRREDAYSAYKRLAVHPTGEVAKKAKQMLFGFAAAKNLKVDTISFDGGRSQAFAKFFSKIESRYDLLPYVPEAEPDPEAEAAALVATVVAVAVAFAPVLGLGLYVWVKNGGGVA